MFVIIEQCSLEHYKQSFTTFEWKMKIHLQIYNVDWVHLKPIKWWKDESLLLSSANLVAISNCETRKLEEPYLYIYHWIPIVHSILHVMILFMVEFMYELATVDATIFHCRTRERLFLKFGFHLTHNAQHISDLIYTFQIPGSILHVFSVQCWDNNRLFE